jgi:hypothetical protein
MLEDSLDEQLESASLNSDLIAMDKKFNKRKKKKKKKGNPKNNNRPPQHKRNNRR